MTCNYFNRQKFWYASDIALAKTKNAVFTSNPIAANDIISIANIGKVPVTVFIQRANVNGYDLTAKEWYANSSNDNAKPAYVHDDDLISDYMVDVIAIKGDWTNYTKLSTDPVYGQYFTRRGLTVSLINNFLQLSGVTVITRQTGCLIPDFQNKAGNTIAIDRVFNNQYPVTELLMSLDTTRLEQYDLTQDTFDASTTATYRLDILGHGVSELAANTASIVDDSDILNAAAPSTYAIVNPMIDTISYRKPTYSTYSYKYVTTATTIYEVEKITVGSIDKVKAYAGSKLYELWKSGHLSTGDHNPVFASSPAADVYIKISGPYSESIGSPSVTAQYILIEGYNESTLSTPVSLSFDSTNKAITFVTLNPSAAVDTAVDPYYMKFEASSDLAITRLTPNKIEMVVNPTIATNLFAWVKPNYYLRAKVDAGRPRVLKIINVSKISTDSLTLYSTYQVLTMPINDPNVEGIDIGDTSSTYIVASKGIYNYVPEIKGYKLAEFTLRSGLMPDGTYTRQSNIYKFLFDSGLDKAITSGEKLNVRHIVDSYEGEISTSAKYYLVKLGAEHAKTLVFLNSPSMSQFESSADPSFVDPYTGLLNAQYISDGGNFSGIPPSFTYRLASGTVNGVPIESFAIYSMPNLVIYENNKNVSMPGAAYVSNAYIRKFKNGNEYGLVAGRKGIITEPEVIGVEYDLTDDDREILEPAGYNLIIRRRGMGTMLYSNNTAYQAVESALNNAHVRDTLITIEQGIEDILANFLFDFNDGITQIRVKTLVDNYLDGVKTSRGISWYNTVFNSSNNTEDVISANAGVIDIYVDFPRGVQKFFNRITITRVGGQLSATQSGFGLAA